MIAAGRLPASTLRFLLLPWLALRLRGGYWEFIGCNCLGWRWLFILEGTPAIVLGIVTLFYLTDWPAQARWLPDDERDWLVNELQTELEAKKRFRDYTITQAFCDRRVLLLIAAFFLAISGNLGNRQQPHVTLVRITIQSTDDNKSFHSRL